MKRGIKGLLACCFISIIITGNLYSQNETKVKVENGAVIIDGKYVEPPYIIEARENGIWINGILAEKSMPRKEQYRESRKRAIQQAIECEVLADYFELSEELGKEKARENIKGRVLNKGKIRGIKIKNIKSETPKDIKIETEDKENYVIKISTESEKYMLRKLVEKKYRLWYNASFKSEKRLFNDLVGFLEKQKRKGRIDAYKFEKGYEFEKDMLKIKYAGDLTWDGIGSAFASTPEDITTVKYPTDEEADKLDKESSQRRIETFRKSLSNNYLEVFSKGGHAYAGPGGESAISELKKVMADKNITLEQRKDKIKKVYRPAEIEEKFLSEILDNFNK